MQKPTLSLRLYKITPSIQKRITFILIGVFALLPFIFSFSMNRMAYDDAFITYRYAKNILDGHGFVYNQGEAVLGTTTPLYALLLAVLGRICPELPVLGRFLGALAWSGSIILIYHIGRQLGDRISGIFAAGFLALSPLVLASVGMETPLYLFLFCCSLDFYLEEKLDLAAVSMALLLLTRGDGILLPAVLGIHHLFTKKQIPWRPLAIYFLITTPWFLYSIITFGSPFPNSLAAKMGQAAKPDLSDLGGKPGHFLYGLVRQLNQLVHDSVTYLLCIPLLLWGLFGYQRSDLRHWLASIWMILYIVGYSALGVFSFPWYYVPLTIPLILLLALGMRQLFDWIRVSVSAPLIAACLIGLILLPLGAGHAESITNIIQAKSGRSETYKQVGEWLRNNSSPSASVTTIEIGIIGYYSDREIIDTMGLITPGITHHLQGWLQSLQYAVSRYQPDFAIALPKTAWDGLLASSWFRDQYQEATRINEVTIFTRRNDAPNYPISQDISFQFTESISITHIDLEKRSVHPGETLNLVLHWQTDSELDTDNEVWLALIDPLTNKVWAKANSAPMHGGAPTNLWLVGKDYPDEHHISVPLDAPFGRYELWVGLNGIKETTPVTSLKIAPLVPLSCPPDLDDLETLDVRFGDTVALLGYKIEGNSHPGENLVLDLCWQAMNELVTDRNVFVHLIDENEQVIAQIDQQPLNGRYPLSIWETGEYIPDQYNLQLPLQLDSGKYQLRFGFYDWITGERLVVNSNKSNPGDFFVLDYIIE